MPASLLSATNYDPKALITIVILVASYPLFFLKNPDYSYYYLT